MWVREDSAWRYEEQLRLLEVKGEDQRAFSMDGRRQPCWPLSDPVLALLLGLS